MSNLRFCFLFYDTIFNDFRKKMLLLHKRGLLARMKIKGSQATLTKIGNLQCIYYAKAVFKSNCNKYIIIMHFGITCSNGRGTNSCCYEAA